MTFKLLFRDIVYNSEGVGSGLCLDKRACVCYDMNNMSSCIDDVCTKSTAGKSQLTDTADTIRACRRDAFRIRDRVRSVPRERDNVES